MSEIIFKNGSGTFSGDISANDASFNNLVMNNLKVINNLEVIGSIGNNLDVIGNLNVGGYIKQRTASWSLGGKALGNISQTQAPLERFKWANNSAPEINCFRQK